MKKNALLFFVLFVLAPLVSAQNGNSDSRIIGEWSIQSIIGINGTENTQLIKDARGEFNFSEDGTGFLLNPDTDEKANILWESDSSEQTITLGNDTYHLEGNYQIVDTMLVMAVIQDKTETYVVILTRK